MTIPDKGPHQVSFMRSRFEAAHLVPPILACVAILGFFLEPLRVALAGDPPSPVLLAAPFVLAAFFTFLALRLNQTAILSVGLVLLAGFLLFRVNYRDTGVWIVPLAIPLWLIGFRVMGDGPLTTATGLVRLLLLAFVPARPLPREPEHPVQRDQCPHQRVGEETIATSKANDERKKDTQEQETGQRCIPTAAIGQKRQC